MFGRTACARKKGARRLVAKTWSHSSIVISDLGVRPDRGIVDEDIDTAQPIVDVADDGAQPFDIGKVGLIHRRLDALLGDLGADFSRGRLVLMEEDDGRGAGFGEGERDGAADIAVSAGDQRALAGNAERTHSLACAHQRRSSHKTGF
jgi:hypothetical protein